MVKTCGTCTWWENDDREMWGEEATGQKGKML